MSLAIPSWLRVVCALQLLFVDVYDGLLGVGFGSGGLICGSRDPKDFKSMLQLLCTVSWLSVQMLLLLNMSTVVCASALSASDSEILLE